MFQNKTDILLFLLYIDILILNRDCRHVSNQHSLCLMFVTCFISNIRRSKSNNSCHDHAFDTNNFFKYLTDWNITKMKYNGKGEMKWIISVIHHGIVLLRNLIFYMIYVGGS